MAVYLDDSSFFKFVIVSDNSRPSKNNFTEKPPKDKEPRDIMSTSSSSPPPNNEKLDEKNQNSQEVNKPPEVKVFDTPNSNGDSTKEQKNEEKSSRLTIEVPTKSSSPQLVASPREIKSKTPEPAISPIPSPQNSIFKKIGNMIRSTSDSGTNPDQEETATSDSKDQVQQEQPKDKVQQEQPKDKVQQEQPKDKVQQEQPKDQVQQEQQVVDNTVANDKITENTVNSPGSIDENKKEGEDKKITPEPTPAKRTGSLSNLVNMKSFITRTSSLVVEKLQEKFDSLDRKIYPDMDPEYPDLVEEEQNKSSREAAISEREQLLGNKDIETTNGTSQIPQSTQSTQNVMAEVGVALNERKEKLDKIGERTEELSNNASNFAELAAQLRKEQEKKSKSWFW